MHCIGEILYHILFTNSTNKYQVVILIVMAKKVVKNIQMKTL